MAKYIDDVQIMHFDLVVVSSKGSRTPSHSGGKSPQKVSLDSLVRARELRDFFDPLCISLPQFYSMVRAEEEHDYSAHLIIEQPRSGL